MKKIIYLLFFSLPILSNGQSKNQKEVAESVQAFNRALINADKNILLKMTSDELSYGHSNGKVENKNQFVDGVVNGPVDFLTIDISDQQITIAGKNAVVRHVFSSKMTNNGIPSEIKIGNLLVWQKQKGKWKLLARQGFKI